MVWPASDVNTSNSDADNDNPLLMRQNLLDLMQKFNAMRVLAVNKEGDALTGMLTEAYAALAAASIDLALGAYFSKTITGATTFTLANVPAAGKAVSFILDLTNGGSATITWWAGIKWAKGTAPTLTAAGRDVLGFFSYNGGATWTGLLLGKDVK